MTRRIICLITPGHVASTPRLTKAASALAADGFEVHVVAGRPFPPVNPLDEAALNGVAWQCTRVPYHSGLGGFLRRTMRRAARLYLTRTPAAGFLAAPAHHAGIGPLVRTAARIPAHLYLGHGGVAGLAAAASAATRRGQPFGFDAEDWHPGETDFVRNDPAERAAVDHLLHRFLSKAQMLTCASPLIGDCFAREFGVTPQCILNVFPRAEAPATAKTVTIPTKETPAVLYWFSQTIGPGRGLEAIVEILGHLKTPALLQLRGFCIPGYDRTLQNQLTRIHTSHRIQLLPSAPPGELVRLASEAHLGLSIEQSSPPNRDVCLTNKVFTYLLAGVPQVLSRTSAQSALAPELGNAAMLIDLSDSSGTARKIDLLLSDQAAMDASRRKAYQLGQNRFCWEIESEKLVAAVRRIFDVKR